MDAPDDDVACLDIDVPLLRLLPENGEWSIDAEDYAVGMRGADFVNWWRVAVVTVLDICNFCFGDLTRMAKKER